MKILVIGGSMFLGRVFTMIASKDHELTLLNRGNYDMSNFGVNQITMDRHDLVSLRKVSKEFDVVVDFCAYKKDDINDILNNISSNVKKYVFVSTCDVYERDTLIKNEDSSFNKNTSEYPEMLRDYIDGKIILENELIEASLKKNIDYVSVRPGLIYGPFNYAYRESMYFDNIINNHVALFPSDANAYFEIVYVKDVAEAILKICESNKSHAYNICSNELLDYERFCKYLRLFIEEEYQDIFIPYEDIKNLGIELPFPVFKEEQFLCSSMRFKDEYKYKFTRTDKGLEKTYHATKNIYKR